MSFSFQIVIIIALGVFIVAGLLVLMLMVKGSSEHPAKQVIAQLNIQSGISMVILQNSGSNKINVIKEIRVITGLGLKESKDIVDKTPSRVISGIDENSALEIKKRLEDAGAIVSIESSSSIRDHSTSSAGEYSVILNNTGNNIIEVIKEIREVTHLGLKDSKDIVDTVPSTVISGVDLNKAEQIKKQFDAIGAEVQIIETKNL
jgi:ribosomal protein L7/L12